MALLLFFESIIIGFYTSIIYFLLKSLKSFKLFKLFKNIISEIIGIHKYFCKYSCV